MTWDALRYLPTCTHAEVLKITLEKASSKNYLYGLLMVFFFLT